MFTVTQAVNRFKVSKQTIRVWGSEFREHLSMSANPLKGQQRMYTDEDMSVFGLVAVRRSEGMSYADIHAMLAAGERIEFIPEEPVENDPYSEAPQSGVEIFRGVIEDYKTRIDTLEVKIDTLNERLLTSETEKAKLSGKLEEVERVRGEVALKAELAESERQQLAAQLQQSEAARAEAIGRLAEIERIRTQTTLDAATAVTPEAPISAENTPNYALWAVGVLMLIVVIVLIFVAIQTFGT